MPVGPRLRPGATLHYKTRIKTWNNISFLLSLSHNSYDTNWTAQPYTSYWRNHDLCSESKCLVHVISQLISRSRPVFLRRGLNVVDLGPELQCLLKVKEDLI